MNGLLARVEPDEPYPIYLANPLQCAKCGGTGMLPVAEDNVKRGHAKTLSFKADQVMTSVTVVRQLENNTVLVRPGSCVEIACLHRQFRCLYLIGVRGI